MQVGYQQAQADVAEQLVINVVEIVAGFGVNVVVRGEQSVAMWLETAAKYKQCFICYYAVISL